MATVQVPELMMPQSANEIYKFRNQMRNEEAFNMQKKIFEQEQDPMSTQNQLRKLQLEKVRGEVMQTTLEEAITNMGAIDFNNPEDYKGYVNHYDRRLQAAGFNLDEVPPGMRLSPIYKVGANGVQSETLDADAMRKKAREIQTNYRAMTRKSDPTASIGAANLAYRMSKDAYDANKKEEENVDNLYRMITTNAEKPDLVRRDVRNFNKKSKDYEFVLRPQGKAYQTWFLPESAERFLGGTPPTYVAVPKGFTLPKVAELSELSGVTPEEFTEDAVTLMKEYKLTPAQVEKEIRTRYGKK